MHVKNDISTSNYKQYIAPACVLGGVLALSAGQKSISKAVNILKNELSKKPQISEYKKYLTQKEVEAIQRLLNCGFTLREINIFSKIQNIQNKKEFANIVFDEFVKDTGYKKLKPALKFATEDSKNVGAWYALVDELTINNVESLSKANIINTIKHELKHFTQSMDIIRTESLGADALIEGAKYDPANFKSEYPIIYERLKTKEYLAVSEYGKIPLESEKGKMAQKYLQSKKDYVNLTKELTDEEYEAYMNNLLEVEAYEEAQKISDKYFDYIMEIARTKLSGS